ncbi:MAG TPA: hypothetical protein VFB74_33965 [Kribbellaceae bacterium]|nr:hypothetical protein [Kribbellaceae bacterium]
MDSKSHTRTEFYCQWYNERTQAWITPTKWLHSGGYDTYAAAATAGAEWCRMDSPSVGVRVRTRVITDVVIDEVPVPATTLCVDPDCMDSWAEHDKH